MESGSHCRLVAGLGNPGKSYEQTRHNVGFLVVEELARRAGITLSYERRWDSQLVRIDDLVLMKPQTFMNLSGEAVAGFSRFFRIAPEEVLVVIDDVALPLGRLRLRRSGSAGGHNGLNSIITQFGTTEIPRLRVGIGGSENSALHNHVLGRFDQDELQLAAEAVTNAADTIQFLREEGIDAAMNRFNQPTKNRNTK